MVCSDMGQPIATKPGRFAETDQEREHTVDTTKELGWLLFAGIILMLAGVLNLVWGIAAIGESRFFVHNTTYILSDLCRRRCEPARGGGLSSIKEPTLVKAARKLTL